MDTYFNVEEELETGGYYMNYYLLECLKCGAVFKDETPDVYTFLDSHKLDQGHYSEALFEEMTPSCPHCLSGWYQETDKGIQPPTKHIHVKELPPIKLTEEEKYEQRIYALFRFLINRGVPENRAIVRAKSIIENKAFIRWAWVVQQERTRFRERAYQEFCIREEVLFDLDQKMSITGFEWEPEESLINLEKLEFLWSVIKNYWYGNVENLIECIEMEYPGDESSENEKRKYKAAKRKLYLFQERVLKLSVEKVTSIGVV